MLLILGIITIGSQTIRASRQNPVKSLRMDWRLRYLSNFYMYLNNGYFFG
jgi:hypothetical protein